MNITRVNQEKLLDFIKDAVSKVEHEQYEINRLNATNIPYKIYGKPMYKGNVFIIGNRNYIKKVRRRYAIKPYEFIRKNFKFKLNKFKKYMDEDHKAIIIEFTDSPENEPYKFTKVVGIKNGREIYLDQAMHIYDRHSKNGEPNSVSMEHFSRYLDSFDHIFAYKSQAKQKVLKSLNGKPIKET